MKETPPGAPRENDSAHHGRSASGMGGRDPRVVPSAARISIMRLRSLNLFWLAIVAIRAQTRIEWDAATAKVTNNTDANRFIGPRLRLTFLVGAFEPENRKPITTNFPLIEH
jgi:hypothetical protein